MPPSTHSLHQPLHSHPPALVDALSALRAALRGLGSDLAIRVGAIDSTVAEFVAENGVGTVMTEREVEARWVQWVGGWVRGESMCSTRRQWSEQWTADQTTRRNPIHPKTTGG
jgi:hypothetical protein